jgi:hypothetical protein
LIFGSIQRIRVNPAVGKWIVPWAERSVPGMHTCSIDKDTQFCCLVGVDQWSDAVESLIPPRFANLGGRTPAGLSPTYGQSSGSSAEILDMARSSHNFMRVIERLLGRLAIPTEDGRLIYHDIMCMSWAAVCDSTDALGHERDTDVSDVEIDHRRQG